MAPLLRRKAVGLCSHRACCTMVVVPVIDTATLPPAEPLLAIMGKRFPLDLAGV